MDRYVEPTQPMKPVPRRLDLVRREHHLPSVPPVDFLDGLLERLGLVAIRERSLSDCRSRDGVGHGKASANPAGPLPRLSTPAGRQRGGRD